MIKRHIRKLVGELTAANFDRVSEVIFEDKVVGLDLLIDRAFFEECGVEDGMPRASLDESKVTLSKSTSEDGGVEININYAFSPQWGTYRIDGVFSVKSGGVFQGVACVGLVPTDEALVRLNLDVKIIEIQI